MSEIKQIGDTFGLDHLDAAEKILTIQPQFINEELTRVLDLDSDPKESGAELISKIKDAEELYPKPKEYRFLKNAKQFQFK